MDPITLIVAALAAGASSALQDDAKGAVKAAFARLRTLAKNRLAGRQNGEFVLEQHETAPEIYEKPLEHELKESGAATDSELVGAAEEFMKLVDARGAAAGKYVVNMQNASGVQIGDHNKTYNFGTKAAGRDFYNAERDQYINRAGGD